MYVVLLDKKNNLYWVSKEKELLPYTIRKDIYSFKIENNTILKIIVWNILYDFAYKLILQNNKARPKLWSLFLV